MNCEQFSVDSSGQVRDIYVRFVREHAVENNEWGDFQTHRRLLGLITVGKFESQGELNEVNYGIIFKNSIHDFSHFLNTLFVALSSS